MMDKKGIARRTAIIAIAIVILAAGTGAVYYYYSTLKEEEGPPTPTAFIYLDPSEISFNVNETPVGHRFNVTAWVSNVTDLFGYQAAIYYNTSVINMTNAWLPTTDSDWVFFGQVGIPLVEYLYYFDSWGYTLIGFAGYTGMTTPVNGTGKLAVFEFEIIASPQDGSLTSPLIISEIPSGIPFEQAFETKLRTPYTEELPSGEPRPVLLDFTATDGQYEYIL